MITMDKYFRGANVYKLAVACVIFNATGDSRKLRFSSVSTKAAVRSKFSDWKCKFTEGERTREVKIAHQLLVIICFAFIKVSL